MDRKKEEIMTHLDIWYFCSILYSKS